MKKVVLYISMSLDGFIATEDDDLSWLSKVEKAGEDYGYHDFVASVDTYIVGRKTYDKVVEMVGEFPQRNQFDCHIITRNPKLTAEGVNFYSGNLKELIAELKTKNGKNIYCDGGGEIVNLLMKDDLIDEYIVSIIPTILGKGKRLFSGINNSLDIKLVETKAFDTGLVQVKYKRERIG